ncbi:MAG: UvrD-helicase domain-containing protein [Paracoccaceae bacterium]
MTLAAERVEVDGGARDPISLSTLSGPPSIRHGLLSSTITFMDDAGHRVVLRGGTKRATRAFGSASESAWGALHLRQLDRQSEQIDRLLREIAALADPVSYPSACKLLPVLKSARDLDGRLLAKIKPEAVGRSQIARVAPIRAFVADPVAMRARAIDLFVVVELARWSEFFDTVEAKPLTPEQRLAIVVDEDATLVLAGAGSGKTSVITAKAAYLLRAGIRTADQILLLAFAKDAAREMSERIEARCGMPIEARTFHALAYDIIGAVEGSKPALAAHATDDMAFIALIREILGELVAAASDVARAILDWFSYFLIGARDELDFKSKHAWYTEVEKLDLRTLKGDQVKSFEELQIANWLYRNGIDYEYEPSYEHAVSGQGRRDYTPDFRLTQSGVYVEHFGVRRKRRADGSEELTTAPFVDCEAYLTDMAWKRQVHTKHGTTLIETYSYDRQEGRLLEALAERLAPHVTLKPRPAMEIYDRVVELGQADSFSRLLGTFLRQFKSGGYSLQDCAEKARKLKLGKRAEAFLRVFEPVFRTYQGRLGDRIDFEDMILRASTYVEEGRFASPFRHILVDEFQDISQSRARLIKALKARHDDARIFAVGDDWQSIYRFAGSDIHIMRNFGEEFGGRFAGAEAVRRTVDLGRTFRSVDKIALPARHFVLRNPAQISKTVIAAGEAKETAIHVAWTRRGDGNAPLHEVLARLAQLPAPPDRQTSVLLLGRYRHVDPGIGDLRRRFSGLTLSYKTIHASKGLEADHVVLLEANRGRTGFPSEITDDPLLSLVSPEAEPFENAEERRVMYVAMTRARFTLTILASESRPSAFVQELLTDDAYGLAPGLEDVAQSCTCGECGGRLLPASSQKGRNWYRCEHVQLCGNILPACATCNTALPRHEISADNLVCPACSTAFPACPSCMDGWLVERSGRYGAFLGCVRYPACSGKAQKSVSAANRR